MGTRSKGGWHRKWPANDPDDLRTRDVLIRPVRQMVCKAVGKRRKFRRIRRRKV